VDLFSFDDDYVRRLREGDRWTEAHFLRYFGELMLVKLRGRVRTMSRLEDIRQEVFLRVFRALRAPEGLRDGRKLGAFVNSVCNNVLLESFRKSGRTEALPETVERMADAGDSIEQTLVTAETKAKVRRVLGELEPRDAKLLRALFFDERPKDEICAEFGVDREYLRVLVFRAKEKFRAAYRTGPREVVSFPSRDTEGGEPSLRR